MQKIGFIGLGIMGTPMAKNLMQAGYDVLAYDRAQNRMDDIALAGAQVATTALDVAKECEIIITMLPNSPHVKTLCLDAGGLIEAAKPGTLIIDMTSGAPGDSQEIYAKLKEKEIHFIDAPVSGGEPMAVAGTLAIMVGGEEADFQVAKPLFAVMGSTATHVGPIGSGNTCKLTNQIIVAGNIAILSEGLMLAKCAGADVEKVFQAIQSGLAGSTVMNAKAPMILADTFKAGFRIDLHIKDLDNAMHTGQRVDAPLPMTENLLAILQELSTQGHGACDHSAIAKHYETLANKLFTQI